MDYNHPAVVENLIWKISNFARLVVLMAVSMNISGLFIRPGLSVPPYL